ncbi:4042_t:CDS:2, partial [Funneliformis geosporum]
MAYQLELIRLTNFDITPCFPARLRNSVSTAEYLISESDRLLKPKQVEAVKGFIDRHGKRLWRLRLTGAEVRFKVEDSTLGTSYPLRVIINNVSGWILKSIGRPHLQPTHAKEWLQPRRYKTYLMGTTYAYDFPELFRQAIRIRWNRASYHSSNLKYSSDVLEAKELVLDENNNLQEVERASKRIHLVWLQISLLFLPPNIPKSYKQLHQNGRKSVIAERKEKHDIKSPILLDQKMGLLLVVQLVLELTKYVRLGQRTIQNE